MDLITIQAMKKKLDAEIHEKITEFEQATGLEVSNLELMHDSPVIGGTHQRVIHVKSEVRL